MNGFSANQIFSEKYEYFLITLLRLSLALIFFWFGALKIFGFNPVYSLIHHSLFPWLASGAGLITLGAAEALIGVLLASNRVIVLTHLLLFFHLLGTFTTFLFGWQMVFDPYFPVLTLGGEFVIKNMILAISGLLVLVRESRRIKNL